MNRSKVLLGLVVLVEGVVGCGSSDSRRTVTTEAGVDASSGGSQSGGSGGRPGTGGSVGGGGVRATGGSVGSGGTSTPPVEAGSETGAPAEAGTPPACPAATDGGRQWRDFAAGVCKACPAAPLSCTDLLASPGPSYDPTSRILNLSLTAGLAELVSADLRATGLYKLQDGGVGFKNTTTSGRVRGNAVTWDFSSQFPASTYTINGGFFTLTDACGAAVTDNNYSFRIGLTPSPDGGTDVAITCQLQ